MQRFKLAISLLAIVLMSLAASHAAFARSTGFVRNHGVRIVYEAAGEGEPLVLIPGFSQSRRAWKDSGLAEAMIASGRQVILIDPRGHGESDKPHQPSAYALEAVASDVICVLDALGIERADLLGYSRGGAIAMAAARLHPERVRSVVAGGAHPYAEDMSPFREAVAGGLAGWVEAIEASAGPLSDSSRAMFLANDVEALRAVVAADRPDQSAALVASGVPVLLYAGSHDPRAARARRFAAESPAVYVELPGLNHFSAFFAVDAAVRAAQGFYRSLRQSSSGTLGSRRRKPVGDRAASGCIAK